MLNDNAKKWVDALRSGNYPQGRNALNHLNTFCCLGVACELAAKDGVNVKVTHEGDLVRYNGYGVSLPNEVKNWLGLTSPFGDFSDTVVVNGRAWHSLAGLNDDGMQFAQIADVIESEPKDLFAEVPVETATN